MTTSPRIDLEALRIAAGVSGHDAANALGINYTTLWRWEHGKSYPGRHTLAAVVAYYERVRAEKLHAQAASADGGAS